MVTLDTSLSAQKVKESWDEDSEEEDVGTASCDATVTASVTETVTAIRDAFNRFETLQHTLWAGHTPDTCRSLHLKS